MALNEKNYHEKKSIENTEKMREIVSGLPGFCKQYFRGIEERASARTRLAYAYDLRVFFEFLQSRNPMLRGRDIKDFRVDILEALTAEDLEEYMEYLDYYEKEGKEYTNDERGKARKLSALRSMYKYFHSHEIIEKNHSEMQEAIQADETGEGFIYEMFVSELFNHEYGYTEDITETLDALGLDLAEVDSSPALSHGLAKAAAYVREHSEF